MVYTVAQNVFVAIRRLSLRRIWKVWWFRTSEDFMGFFEDKPIVKGAKNPHSSGQVSIQKITHYGERATLVEWRACKPSMLNKQATLYHGRAQLLYHIIWRLLCENLWICGFVLEADRSLSTCLFLSLHSNASTRAACTYNGMCTKLCWCDFTGETKCTLFLNFIATTSHLLSTRDMTFCNQMLSCDYTAEIKWACVWAF